MEEGQGHISLAHQAQELVPTGSPVIHSPIPGRKDGVGAFGCGYFSSPPANLQHAMSLCVVSAGQGDIVPSYANRDGGALAHCVEDKRWSDQIG